MSTSPPVTSETPLLAEETLFDMADRKPNPGGTDDDALARRALEPEPDALHVDNNGRSSGTQSDGVSDSERVRVTEEDVCPTRLVTLLGFVG